MIVAGFGFRKGASLSSLRAALALAQKGHEQVTVLATAQDKVDGLLALAGATGLPVMGITAERLIATTTCSLSTASRVARGTGSVSEASALAAAGTGARLLSSRHISPDRMATCAIAQGSST